MLVLSLYQATHAHAWQTPAQLTQVKDFLKESYRAHPILTTTALTAVSCAGLYGAAYALLRKKTPPLPQSLATVNCTTLIRNSHDVTTIAHIKNIGQWLQTKNHVTIFCTGFVSARESNIAERGAHALIKKGLVPAYHPDGEGTYNETVPVVTFDFPDNPETFNFGQTRDQHYLDLVYKEIIKQNRDIKITLVGICRGALTILNYLANKTNREVSNIKAVILDEPANPSMKELIHPISYFFAKPFFPHYQENHPTFFDALSFPRSIPIALGSIEGDAISSRANNVVKRLRNFGCSQLYNYTHNKRKHIHGLLVHDHTFVWLVNMMLYRNNLPNALTIYQELRSEKAFEEYRVT